MKPKNVRPLSMNPQNAKPLSVKPHTARSLTVKPQNARYLSVFQLIKFQNADSFSKTSNTRPLSSEVSNFKMQGLFQ